MSFLRTSQLDMPDFSRVQCYVTFAGNGRTGTSLLAAILDAHPHAIVSHQLRAARLLRRCSRDQLFRKIVLRSRSHLRGGKRHYQYSYLVPGGAHATADPLLVIGDKYAGPDTDRLARNGYELLRTLQHRMSGLRLCFIHAVRNPFDAISTHKRRYHTTLRRAIHTCARRDYIVRDLIDMGCDVRTIFHEEVRHNPSATIQGLLSWLGLAPDPDFVSRASGLVVPAPHYTRHDVRWSSSDIELLSEHCARFEWLRSYRYELLQPDVAHSVT